MPEVKWTIPRLDHFRALYESGVAVGDIATEFSISIRRVYWIAWAYEMHRQPSRQHGFTATEKRAFRRLRQQHISRSEAIKQVLKERTRK